MTVAVLLFSAIWREIVPAVIDWVQRLALVVAEKVQSRVLLFQIPFASLLTPAASTVAIGAEWGATLGDAHVARATLHIVGDALTGVLLKRFLALSQRL